MVRETFCNIDIDRMYDECEKIFTILRHIVENDTMNCGYQWQDYTLEVLDSYESALQKLNCDMQGQLDTNNTNNDTANGDLSDLLKNKSVAFE